MRFWNPPINPDNPPIRRRTAQRKHEGEHRFPLTPIFSDATEEQPPSESTIGPEARVDDLTPEDRGPGSQDRADRVLAQGPTEPVVMTYSPAIVSSPPTDQEIRDLFGTQQIGFVGLIIRSAVVWMVVKGSADAWWYEQLTKAT